MNAIDITPPKDPRHQRFAELIYKGTGKLEAYKQAGFPKTTYGSAATLAGRLLKNVEIKRYLSDLQKSSATATVLSAQERREFLARVVRTPLLKIDPHGKDGDLILKYKETTTEAGGTVEWVKPDPIKCIVEDARLAGEDPETLAATSLADALRAIAHRSVIPTDKM